VVLLLFVDKAALDSSFRDGESCPDAKPSLVTSENSFLSPFVGGLVEVEGLFPKAVNKCKMKLLQLAIRIKPSIG
jgi:hypothetical protein